MKKSATIRLLSLFVPALILNFLLFLPQFLVNREIYKHLPDAIFGEYSFYPIWSFFLIRDHFDIFRFNCDYLLLLVIAGFIVTRIRSVGLISVSATIIYMSFMLYNIYYEVSVRLYTVHPYFKSDFALVKGVLPTFLKEIGWGEIYHYGIFVWLILMVGGVVFVIWKLIFQALLKIQNPRKMTYMTLAVVPFLYGGVMADQLFNSDGYKQSWKTMQWTSPKIWKSMNMPASSEKSSLDNLKVYQSYMQLKLHKLPNIYCIFVESYGAVAFHSKYGKQHKAFLTNMDSDLRDEGWFSASTYSKAPIAGGRSWLSFTSALSGIHIESQIQFNDLLESHSDYPHFVRWLKHQGYQTFRMKTMSNVRRSTPKLNRLSDTYYDFDLWIKHEDITYKGYKYDEYYGGIPDQYAMNQFYEDYLIHPEDPYFLFFITMTSHLPWQPPPPILQNWKDLDQLKEKPQDFDLLFDQPDIDRYHKSIEYSLSVMKKFMLDKLENDSTCIFILVGDHQPPKLPNILEGKKDSFAVPVHIFSKDAVAVNSFQELGFTPGLFPNEESLVTLKHEALYSLMVNRLVYLSGKAPQDSLPEILMNGL